MARKKSVPTDTIFARVPVGVKDIALELADERELTLTNYIIELIRKDAEAAGKLPKKD
jgi:hypothetical protein